MTSGPSPPETTAPVPAAYRPLRSALYLPGSNARAIEKSRTLPCDAVILDLEDSVDPQAKDAARDQVLAALRLGGFGRRQVVVRVNGLDTPWGEADLAALSAVAPDAVLVPKIEDAGDLARYDARLSGAPERTALWAMVETCRSLFHLDSIAGSKATRLGCLVLGTNDLAKAMNATPGADRAPLLAALSLSVAAARAHSLDVLDGVCNRLDDDAGLARECEQGCAFGFDGKTLVHPRQIETANRLFSPSPERLAWARAVVDAFLDPQNQGRGTIRVQGEMAERLHLAQAERLLATARAMSGETSAA